MNVGEGRRWLDLTSAAVLIAFFAVAFAADLRAPAAPMDEGSLLVYPEMIRKGLLPYRDFETFYGPGNIFVLAGIYSVFGTSIAVERIAGLCYRLIILGAVFFIGRRRSLLLGLGSIAIAGLLLTRNPISASTWIAALAGSCVALALIDSRTPGPSGLAGLFAGASILCRPDLGPGVVIAFLPALLILERKSRIWFLFGLLIAVSGLIFFALTDRQNFYGNILRYPVFVTHQARHLPLSSAPWQTKCLLALTTFAVTIEIAAASMAWRKRRPLCDVAALWALAILATSGLPLAFHRADFGHVLLGGLLAITFLPLAFFTLFSLGAWSHHPRRCGALALSLVACALFATMTPAYVSGRDGRPVEGLRRTGVEIHRGSRAFFLADAVDAQISQRLIEALDRLVRPGQRFFVGTGDLSRTPYNDTFWYYLYPELVPATYFLEFNPKSANRSGSRLMSDLESSDWVLLNRRWDYWNEPNSSVERGSEGPNLVLRQQFAEVAECGSYLLLRRK